MQFEWFHLVWVHYTHTHAHTPRTHEIFFLPFSAPGVTKYWFARNFLWIFKTRVVGFCWAKWTVSKSLERSRSTYREDRIISPVFGSWNEMWHSVVCGEVYVTKWYVFIFIFVNGTIEQTHRGQLFRILNHLNFDFNRTEVVVAHTHTNRMYCHRQMYSNGG